MSVHVIRSLGCHRTLNNRLEEFLYTFYYDLHASTGNCAPFFVLLHVLVQIYCRKNLAAYILLLFIYLISVTVVNPVIRIIQSHIQILYRNIHNFKFCQSWLVTLAYNIFHRNNDEDQSKLVITVLSKACSLPIFL